MTKPTTLLAIVGAIVLAVVSGVFFTVDEREQALVVLFGDPKRTITEPGLHFKLPIVEQVIRVDKRILSLDIPPQTVLASDQRRIVVDSFARFRVTDPLKMYLAAVNENRAKDRLRGIMVASVRAILAKQEMGTIVSGERVALMEEITADTNAEAENLGLEVLDVRLKRVDLPAANSQAIFDRMRTEREREAKAMRAQGKETAERILADADRQATIIAANAEREAQFMRGEADAKAVKIFADAFGKDEDFFEFYRTMQAYRKSLGNDDTTLVLSPDSDFFKLFVTDGDR